MKNLLKFTFLAVLALLTPAYHLHAQNPAPPVIRSVSVVRGTDTVEMRFSPSPSNDIKFYVIHKMLGIQGTAIDTSFRGADTVFRFRYPAVLADSVSFSLWAVDSLLNHSYLSIPSHTTNFLELIPDTCTYTLHVHWTGYRGWGVHLSYYTLELQQQGQLPVFMNLIATVSDTILANLQPNVVYSALVHAYRDDGLESLSNIAASSIHKPTVPAYLNADYATTDTSGNIRLSFTVDNTSEITSYFLFRKDGVSGSWSKIADFFDNTAPVISYTDPVNAQQRHFYKLAAVNACGSAMAESNLAGNIVLSGKMNNSRVALSWNPYYQWKAGNGNMKVQRMLADGSWEEAANLGLADSSYTDDLTRLVPGNYSSRMCYRIEATEAAGNPQGVTGQSISNVICFEIQPGARIPNAFTPNGDGRNDLFKPEFDFIPDNYLMRIFDRRGNIVFETTDFSKAWDGTGKDGQPVAEGAYIYYIHLRINGLPQKEYKGTVSVIYP